MARELRRVHPEVEIVPINDGELIPAGDGLLVSNSGFFIGAFEQKTFRARA